MQILEINYAKKHFSDLLHNMNREDEYLITENNKPLARITSVSEKKFSSEGIIKKIRTFRKKNKLDDNLIEMLHSGRR